MFLRTVLFGRELLTRDHGTSVGRSRQLIPLSLGMACNDLPSIPAKKPRNRLSSTTKNEIGVARTIPAKRDLPQKIVFLSFNARSLFNKIGELELLIKTHSPFFISIEETWCIPYEPNSFYTINATVCTDRFSLSFSSFFATDESPAN